MPQSTKVRVKEVRGIPSPSGGGGLHRQVRVIDEEPEEVTSQQEVVPSDTPLHDWEDEK